jgi:CHAD domain-containing protein
VATTLCLEDRGIDTALVAVLRAQIDEVSTQVRGAEIDWEERVHQIRAGLKASRATLRLLQQGMGEQAWQETNVALRDAGRIFSEVRDADVLLACCRRLSRQRRLRGALQGFEEAFLARQRESRERIARGGAVAKALDLLSAARQRVQNANAGGGWEGVWRGVRRVYGRGRRAWTDGERMSDADQRHELRKRSKDMRLQLRLFSSLAPEWPAPMASWFHELTDHLGEERDLYLFGQAVSQSGLSDSRRARPLMEYLDQTRHGILRRVHALARQVFQDDRRTFGARTRSEFERALSRGGRGRAVRRMAAVGAASILAATTALWLSRERPAEAPRSR